MVLTDFSIDIDQVEVMNLLRLGEDFRDEFAEVCAQVRKLAKPKAVLSQSQVTSWDEAGLSVDGQRIDSRIAALNIAAGAHVLPYVVTCGMELHEYFRSQSDPLVAYWCDTLNMHVLREAIKQTHERAEKIMGADKLFAVNPGSTVDWPLTGQRLLFGLIGDVTAQTGVRLEESCLMTPTKSVSGIFFSGDKEYCNCMLCPREKCPNRRAKRMEDPCFA